MALKKNSLKLLSWLYFDSSIRSSVADHSQVQQPAILTSDLPYFFPELTSGGQRSLISLMVSDSLIERVPYSPSVASGLLVPSEAHKQGSNLVVATTNGVDLLSRQFPAFKTIVKPWKGVWTVIAFLEAPKSDPQFRYLRSKLLTAQAGQMKAGLYIYPGDLPEDIFVQLKELYVGSVVIWQTSQWRFGDERNIIGTIFGVHKTMQALSGVSNDLDLLLSSADAQKGLTEKQKKKIFMVFDRFYEIIIQDSGIFSWYFPQAKKISEILYDFHRLYER